MTRCSVSAFAAALICLAPSGALASNGYFAFGYGTHYKGMAGAGVGLSLNALGPATNPAASAFLGSRWDVSMSLFNPNRSYTVEGNPSGYPGTFGLAPGTVESDSRYFPVPALGGNWQIGEKAAFGVALYGNGGMNTDWPTATFNGGAPTGVNLSQMFLAPTYARRIADKHAIGVSVIGSVQWFEVKGVSAFAPYSTAPTKLSNNDSAYSYGGGFRVGYLGRLSEHLAIGASYQSRIWMSTFDEYSGLFAERGDFDVPSNWVVGVAVKPNQKLDVMLDVQQIRYSEVNSVGSPMLPALGQCGGGDRSACLGAENGSGFGWRDMTIVKGGAQLRTGTGWTWRAGYSHGRQPIPDSETLFNILAPGVQEDHVTLGFSKALRSSQEVSFAVMRSFAKKVKGTNPLEAPGQQTIELDMDQWDFEVSWSFGIRR